MTLQSAYLKKLYLYLTLIALSVTMYSQSVTKEVLKPIDVLIQKNQFEEAKVLIDSIISQIQPEADGYLLATTKLIEVNNRKGTYADGVQVGNQLINQNPDLLGLDKRSDSEFYLQLGMAYHLTQSNEEKGISYLNRSLALYKESKVVDLKYESNLLRWIGGSYYYQGAYETSIKTHLRRIKLLDPKNDQTELAVSFRSIGNSYWGLRDYDQAADYYSKGLEVLYSANPVDSVTIGQVLHAKGYIHMDQEDYQQAYETFAQASVLLAKGNSAVSSPMVWVYGDVGRSLWRLGNYEESLVWLQKALNANVYEFNQDDYYQNPSLDNINDDFQHFMILKLKGQAFQDKYMESKDEEDLIGMIDCFRLADQQVDNIRKSIPKAEDQSSISYYSTELYSKAISSLVNVFEENPDPSFLELAHYFMEKQKITRVHLKFLEASAKTNKLLPEELLDRDQNLLDQITDLKTKMLDEMKQDGDSVGIMKNRLFEIQESYEQFISEIETDYPAYHNFRFNLKVSSVSEVQQQLSSQYPDRAIVTYYNFRNSLFTSVITKDTIAFAESLDAYELEEMAMKFRESLTDPNKELIGLDSLSQLLLSNISDVLIGKTKITFVLDPVLQLVPMELLQLEGKYLFEAFDIGYHFSSTMFIKQDDNQFSSDRFVGFAPNFGVTDEITSEALVTIRSGAGLDPLPGAEQEVTFLSEMVKGKGFIRESATEENLKQSIKDAGLIHLATHAVVNQENPESSYLQLGKSEVMSEDGKLHFFEIYNLELNAQLVTLSACNTGYGKLQRGEGVMSLSRAFAYAGVPATVVSLWPASDKSTPELMKYFYQNLDEGQAKDMALNNARKQYLATASGKARHPFYWGGFVMIGDNNPIESDRNLLVYLLPSVLVVVMILTVYRRKKKQQVL